MTEIPAGQSKIDELNFRRALCLAIIKWLSGVDDPRKADALKEYNRQLSEIDKRIAEITGEPPPVVIGLKTAVLFAKSEK